MVLKELTDQKEVENRLSEIGTTRRSENYLLVIDGETLNACIFRKKDMEK